TLLLADPLGEFHRAKLLELVTQARRRSDGVVIRWRNRLRQFPAIGTTLDRSAPVNRNIRQEVEQLGRSITAGWPAEQLRRLVNERRSDLACLERVVKDQLVEEGNVGLHATNAKFTQSAIHS